MIRHLLKRNSSIWPYIIIIQHSTVIYMYRGEGAGDSANTLILYGDKHQMIVSEELCFFQNKMSTNDHYYVTKAKS